MKPAQFYILAIVSAACLILAVVGIALGNSNQHLQMQLQQQQEEINRGNQSQQVGTNIIRDIAQASVNDDKLKEVLNRAGFTLKVNPATSGSSSSTSGTSETTGSNSTTH